MRARVLRPVAILGLILTLGCSDESGPREFSVTIGRDGGEVGAATVEVTGSRIIGFVGSGSSVVFSSQVEGATGRWRVVVVHEGPGDPGFVIQVSDGRGFRPTFSVVEAVDRANEEIDPVSGVTATFGS